MCDCDFVVCNCVQPTLKSVNNGHNRIHNTNYGAVIDYWEILGAEAGFPQAQ